MQHGWWIVSVLGWHKCASSTCRSMGR